MENDNPSMKPEQSGITGGSGAAGMRQPAFFVDAAAIQAHNQAIEAERAKQSAAAAEARAFATRSPAARFAHYMEYSREWYFNSGFIPSVVADLRNDDGMPLTKMEYAAILGRATIMRQQQQGNRKDVDRLLACFDEVGE